jgi:DNA-binding NarL/FixJ family response regulator
MEPKTAQSAKLARVLLADGDAGAPALVSAAIAAECHIVGTVYDGHAAVDATLGLQPDILLTDTILPGLNGLDVILRLVALKCPAKIVILTALEDPENVTETLRAGAAAFVYKRRIKNDLLIAIREVLNGRNFVSSRK